VLQEFDAEADWIEKAIDQHDPNGALYLRLFSGSFPDGSCDPLRAGQA